MKEEFNAILDEIKVIATKLMENKNLAGDIVESHLRDTRDALKGFNEDLDKVVSLLKEKYSKKDEKVKGKE